ncbi:tRNA (adenosine(37)-N6)-threonylcarbamoyltransferase complex ATPase subunit type 1 TsaE [Mycoplasma todarodis]|uniref:tRNA (adenosine(37)-N6)-threonylcarbamoyltransferase complex ATPase subunit type 1 TsaE n=1 Tax=Mycoplasma todarodis TaxID=1937191 RepID=UPI003B2FAE6A
MKHISTSLQETKTIAYNLVEKMKETKTKFILFNGQMGAGKTTLIKFMAEALGEKSVVTSPTFNIMKVYEKFIHIDAYKISGTLEEYEDYFEDKFVFIEWSKNLDEDFDDSIMVAASMNEKNEHIYEIK